MYVNQLMPDYDEYDLKNKFVFGDDGHTIWIKDFLWVSRPVGLKAN